MDICRFSNLLILNFGTFFASPTVPIWCYFLICFNLLLLCMTRWKSFFHCYNSELGRTFPLATYLLQLWMIYTVCDEFIRLYSPGWGCCFVFYGCRWFNIFTWLLITVLHILWKYCYGSLGTCASMPFRVAPLVQNIQVVWRLQISWNIVAFTCGIKSLNLFFTISSA
jgi:hypothetical protein